MMDYGRTRRELLADAQIDPRTVRVIQIIDGMITDVMVQIETQRHVNACLGGTEGMDSACAAKSWDERQARKLLTFSARAGDEAA